MIEQLDWSLEKKAEFRRVMTPHLNHEAPEFMDENFPRTNLDRTLAIELTCQFLFHLNSDDDFSGDHDSCRRCGVEIGCGQWQQVMEMIFGPRPVMTEEEKVKFRKIKSDHIAEQRKNWRYCLRGIQATPINEVVAGMRGEVVVSGLVTKISSEFVNTPVRVKRRNGRVLTGLTTMLNVYVRDDYSEMLCQVGRFDYERLAPKIINHGRANKGALGLRRNGA